MDPLASADVSNPVKVPSSGKVSGYKSVAAFILSNALRLVLLLVAVSIVTFALVTIAPVDPLTAYLGGDSTLSEAQKQNIADTWGLYDPPVERYLAWVGNVMQGDWGTSLVYRQPVIDVVGERFIASLALMGLAWVLSGVFGFVLGIVSGLHPRSWVDRIIKALALLMSSAPTFWLALLALMFFSVMLGWFPLGLASPAGVLAEDVSLLERLHHLILPALVLSVVGIAPIALHTREKVIEVMKSDYVLFARARGESKPSITKRHLLRNIMLPALTLQFASISELFGGSVLAEQVFSYPGLGNAVVQAGLAGDVPLLLAASMVSALFVFVGNLMANVLYGVINPQIRAGGTRLDG